MGTITIWWWEYKHWHATQCCFIASGTPHLKYIHQTSSWSPSCIHHGCTCPNNQWWNHACAIKRFHWSYTPTHCEHTINNNGPNGGPGDHCCKSNSPININKNIKFTSWPFSQSYKSYSQRVVMTSNLQVGLDGPKYHHLHSWTPR